MLEQDLFQIINRKNKLFESDINELESELSNIIKNSSFLIIGAGGSIGQAVTKEISLRAPKTLHCIDVSENSLVELVRDLRSSNLMLKDFKTFNIDIGSKLFEDFYEHAPRYDYVLNLSALKHVRSEKDNFSLFRLVNTNIFNTVKSVDLAIKFNSKKYFCVSTDKAANPVNFMGASKKIMELFLSRLGDNISISSARFANVAFSNGSLLEGFKYRIEKKQPLAAPTDVKRYFVSSKEAGELCMLSALLGKNSEIFFPKLSEEFDLISLSDVGSRYLNYLGFEPYLCNSEDEAKNCDVDKLISEKKWPCYFSASNTSGEKKFEEFYLDDEDVNLSKFNDIGVITNKVQIDKESLKNFQDFFTVTKPSETNKTELYKVFSLLIENFEHLDTGKNLDDKM